MLFDFWLKGENLTKFELEMLSIVLISNQLFLVFKIV
jgi:hypothetical protein